MIRQFDNHLSVAVGLAATALAASETLAQPDPCGDCDHGVVLTCTPPFDPIDFSWVDQWYLEGTRACQAWSLGYTGDGIIVGICDFGVLETHPDLQTQVEPASPAGCSEPRPNPAPPSTLEDLHGTWMAGIVAAEAYNTTGLCGNIGGIAFDATLAEIFTWDNGVSQTEMADSVTYGNDCGIHIKATSYDLTTSQAFGYMSPVLAAALEDSATSATARNGLGVLQVFAAGNDGPPGAEARCDYDELVSSRYTIAVGAVTPTLLRWTTSTGGSELGSSLHCAAPGSFLFTTGRESTLNFNPAYRCVQGTSYACPAVAGVAALMLEAEPDLSWRDVMEAIVQTAATIDPGTGWHTNQAGNNHSYEYGHGLIDAYEAVSFVTGTNGYAAWEPLLGERQVIETIDTGGYVIAPGETKPFPVNADANMRLEHVELLIDVTTNGSEGIGALEVEIEIERIWPLYQYGRGGQHKTVSVFATARTDTASDYDDALFTSVRHWGENADATWKVRIKNTSTTQTATWNTAELRFYGTAACTADWDMDGSVTAADDTAYNLDHTAGEPWADLNHDQIVDGADLLLWDAIYLAGCS